MGEALFGDSPALRFPQKNDAMPELVYAHVTHIEAPVTISDTDISLGEWEIVKFGRGGVKPTDGVLMTDAVTTAVLQDVQFDPPLPGGDVEMGDYSFLSFRQQSVLLQLSPYTSTPLKVVQKGGTSRYQGRAKLVFSCKTVLASNEDHSVAPDARIVTG